MQFLLLFFGGRKGECHALCMHSSTSLKEPCIPWWLALRVHQLIWLVCWTRQAEGPDGRWYFSIIPDHLSMWIKNEMCLMQDQWVVDLIKPRVPLSQAVKCLISQARQFDWMQLRTVLLPKVEKYCWYCFLLLSTELLLQLLCKLRHTIDVAVKEFLCNPKTRGCEVYKCVQHQKCHDWPLTIL